MSGWARLHDGPLRKFGCATRYGRVLSKIERHLESERS
jgi:hypothetical protein